MKKGASGAAVRALTEQYQAQLMDRLAKPKSPGDSGLDPSSVTRKRRVKSQGDWPPTATKRRHRRVSAPPILPPLTGRGGAGRRLPGTTDRPGSSGATPGVGRQASPLSRLRRAAWPNPTAFNADRVAGAAMPGTNPDPPRDALAKGAPLPPLAGKAADAAGSASSVSVLAIEGMLKGGAERYLPGCARDLPEATAILGTSGAVGNKECSHQRAQARPRRHKKRRVSERAGSRRRDPPPTVDRVECRPGHDGGGNDDDSGVARDRKERDGVKDAFLRRFLHPWQRKLQEERQAGDRLARYEAQLDEEQRRRSQARRAAAESEPCRQAGRRVAARMGRHRRRLRPGGADAARRTGKTRSDAWTAPDARHERPGDDRITDGDEGSAHHMEHTRESCLRAQKTLDAIVSRLEEQGFPARGSGPAAAAGVHEGVQASLRELRRHVAVFKASVSSSGGTEGGTTPGDPRAPLGSQWQEACDRFEDEFDRLVERISSQARAPPALQGGTASGRARDAPGGGRSREPRGAALRAASGARPSSTARASGPVRCPSCGLVPAARRCTDCEGGAEGTDCCSACFARNHRTADGRPHRFLEISGTRDANGTPTAAESPSRGKSDATRSLGSPAGGFGSGGCVSTGRGDRAAVSSSATEPSRGGGHHATEPFQGTEVCQQGAHHLRDVPASRNYGSGEARIAGSSRGDETGGGKGFPARREGTPGGGDAEISGEDVFRSLAQVRKTVPPLLVRPALGADTEANVATHSPARPDGNHVTRVNDLDTGEPQAGRVLPSTRERARGGEGVHSRKAEPREEGTRGERGAVDPFPGDGATESPSSSEESDDDGMVSPCSDLGVHLWPPRAEDT